MLTNALYLHRWNVSAAARWLGLGRATVYRLMQEFGLHRPAGERVVRATGGKFWACVRLLGVCAMPCRLAMLTDKDKRELLSACRAGWKVRCKETHPDMGGSAEQFTAIQHAWDVVRMRLQ